MFVISNMASGGVYKWPYTYKLNPDEPCMTGNIDNKPIILTYKDIHENHNDVSKKIIFDKMQEYVIHNDNI